MATIELDIDEQTLARARQVAEARQTSVEAICAEVVERIGTEAEITPPPMVSEVDFEGPPIDEQTLAYAQRIARVNNWSVEAAFEHILSKPRPPRPQDPGGVPRNSIIGLLADEPDLADAIMESAYELRGRPLRLPPGE